MGLKKPNIFELATKELSHDAFITWLLQWGNKENKIYDKELYKCGLEFASKLIKKQYEEFNDEILIINARRQEKKIDIWVEINNKYLVIIEDKTNTKEHSEQLSIYKKEAKKFCNRNKMKLVCIYLKTGNECQLSLKEVKKKGYSIFNRKDFIDLLNKYNIENQIFKDFKEHLIAVDNIYNQWDTKIIDQWNENDWQGFYQYLENEMYTDHWGKANNPSGGYWWAILSWDHYGNYPLYLRIEQEKLCIKICTHPDDIKRPMPRGITNKDARDRGSKFVLNKARKYGFNKIERPDRFGTGNTMTVAVVYSNDWLGETGNLIDKNKVKENIDKYKKFMKKILRKEKRNKSKKN